MPVHFAHLWYNFNVARCDAFVRRRFQWFIFETHSSRKRYTFLRSEAIFLVMPSNCKLIIEQNSYLKVLFNGRSILVC